MTKPKYSNHLPACFAKPLSARTTYGQWCTAINKRTAQLHSAALSSSVYVDSIAKFTASVQPSSTKLEAQVDDIHAKAIAQLHFHIANSNMPHRNESIVAYYDMPTLHYCMLVVAMYERYALHSYCDHAFRANLIAKRILEQEIGHDIVSVC